MRVALYPADGESCDRYRMRYPAAAVEALGADVEIVFPESLPIRRSRRNPSVITDAFVDADVVVLQRPTTQAKADLIPLLQRRGVAVVAELDDDLAALHARHPMFPVLHPRANAETNWHHLKRACRAADLTTVTTPALAQHYGGRMVEVLPNFVPSSMLDIEAQRDGRTVGWGGWTLSHTGDLTVTRGGVGEAVSETGARFVAVGPLDGVAEQLRLPAEPQATGMLEFDAYHQALACLDVAIAPLAESRFNAAKSALKALEYAALGIPFVASPRPDYQRVHADGLGLLAKDRSRDWRRQVKRLLDDAALRLEMAARGREIVRERHTYERNGWRWLNAWEHALELRRAGKLAA